MRSEPTTLGPLPQGAENQCSGRGAFFFFFNSIDSHLPPPVHCHCPVRWGQARTKRQEGNLLTLQAHMCLVQKLYVLFIWIILTFLFLGLPPSPNFSWDPSPASFYRLFPHIEPTLWLPHSWKWGNGMWKYVPYFAWSLSLDLSCTPCSLFPQLLYEAA